MRPTWVVAIFIVMAAAGIIIGSSVYFWIDLLPRLGLVTPEQKLGVLVNAGLLTIAGTALAVVLNKLERKKA